MTTKKSLDIKYKKYGVNDKWFKSQMALQNGRCWICRNTPKKMPLNIDHCHANGEVRALLCWRCNHHLVGAVEMYKNAPEVLDNLIKYFHKYPLRGVKLGLPVMGGKKKFDDPF